MAGLFGATSITVEAERLPIRFYTTADGLPSQFVERVFRDSRGFLWFATREGLSRFDGARFVTYGVRDGLPHLGINDILESRSGTYWIATNGAGVARLDARSIASSGTGTALGRLQTFVVGDTQLSAHVNTLYEDAAARIWAGTDAGLFVWEERAKTFRRVLLGLPSREEEIAVHKALLDDDEGGLWVGTSLGLVRHWADGRNTWYRSPFNGIGPPETVLPESSAAVRALLRDSSGRVWIGTHDGLLIHVPSRVVVANTDDRPWHPADCSPSAESPTRARTLSLPDTPGSVCRFSLGDRAPANWISALFAAEHGEIWVGSLGGLHQITNGEVRSYAAAHGLPDAVVIALAEDRDGNLWIATSSGAARLAAEGLITFTEEDGLGAGDVNWIGQDPGGILHVVGGAWSISRFDGSRFLARQMRVPSDPLPAWGTHAASLDSRGHWWAVTRRGLFHFPGARPPRVYRSRDGLAADDTLGVFEDSAGNTWIATEPAEGRSLARLERATDRIQLFSAADGLQRNAIATAFVEHPPGTVWFGFRYGGLARYRDGRFRMFTAADGVPAGQISALHVDHTGHLWIGSVLGGAGRMEHTRDDVLRIRTYTTADGLLSDNVRCFVEDLQGRLYVGTGKGITRLDPATGHVRQFTTSHGLANDFLTTAFRDRRGTLWFGTLRGLSRLDPSVERSPMPPIVSIAGVRVAGESIALPGLGLSNLNDLTFGPSQNHVQVEFFGIGESLRFRYRLQGIGVQWLDALDQRTITYATLAPGTYRFEVEALTPHGVVSEHPAAVTFTIQAPLWRRTWFIAACLAAFAAAVHVAYWFRLRRVLAVERIRTRIATDLHDDIGSSLSQIAILSDLARHQAASTGASTHVLTSIAATARETVDAMSDIVWALNPRRDSLLDVTQRIRSVATDALSTRNIQLTFVTGEPVPLGLDAHMRRELLLVVKEAVNNIVRHAGATEVNIDVRVHSGRLELRITDNGRGFEWALITRGLGMTSLRQRAEKLRGTCTIDSAPGQGTTVLLDVPLPRRQFFRA